MEGSDGTADTTTLVQIEEAKCAIRKLPFVTVLAPIRTVGDKGAKPVTLTVSVAGFAFVFEMPRV